MQWMLLCISIISFYTQRTSGLDNGLHRSSLKDILDSLRRRQSQNKLLPNLTSLDYKVVTLKPLTHNSPSPSSLRWPLYDFQSLLKKKNTPSSAKPLSVANTLPPVPRLKQVVKNVTNGIIPQNAKIVSTPDLITINSFKQKMTTTTTTTMIPLEVLRAALPTKTTTRKPYKAPKKPIPSPIEDSPTSLMSSLTNRLSSFINSESKNSFIGDTSQLLETQALVPALIGGILGVGLLFSGSGPPVSSNRRSDAHQGLYRRQEFINDPNLAHPRRSKKKHRTSEKRKKENRKKHEPRRKNMINKKKSNFISKRRQSFSESLGFMPESMNILNKPIRDKLNGQESKVVVYDFEPKTETESSFKNKKLNNLEKNGTFYYDYLLRNLNNFENTKHIFVEGEDLWIIEK